MRFKLRDGMELFYTIDDFTDPGLNRRLSYSTTAWPRATACGSDGRPF